LETWNQEAGGIKRVFIDGERLETTRKRGGGGIYEREEKKKI